MSNVLRLAIVDPNDSTRESLKSTLLGMDMVWLEAECSRYEFFADVISQTNPDIGLVCIDHNPEKALELIADINAASPEVSLAVVSSSSDGNLVLQAMRAGVKEFITSPFTIEDIVSALERISNQRFGGAGGKSRSSTVITVAGATGGVGTTSIAVNLASGFAAQNRNSVVLVDLDLALGDADVFLDSIPDYTLVDVAQNISRLDFALLKKSLTKHSSGLYLLPRPVQLSEIEEINADDFQRVIGLLKATFSHVIIDTSKSYSAVDMVAIQAANHVMMVTQLDLPCLRNVVRLMMSFGEYEGLAEKTKILVNRVGLGGGEISLKKAEETLSRKIYWRVPNDYRTMSESRNNGVPLVEQAPKAGVTQSMLQLCDALAGKIDVEDTDDAGSLSGWFNFFSKSGKKKPVEAEAEAE